MRFDTIYIQNLHETALQFYVEKRLSLAAPTQRRNRSMAFPLLLPVGGTIDVCAQLDVKKNDARAILDSSPEYTRLRDNFGHVREIDYELCAIEALGEALQALTVERAQPAIEVVPVVEAPVAEVLTAPAAMDDVQGAIAALPTGAVQIDAADSPSSGWPQERLYKYALGLGLSVTENMSKNAILKKIRKAT